MSKNITFVILTFNEAARIERVIKNFISYGNVLLADDNSTDGTIDIAKSFGCEVLTRTEKYDFVENQHLLDLITEKVTTDWIYWGFADEMFEKQGLDIVSSIIADDKHDIINIDRKNYFYGKFCGNLYHVRMNRLFKKNAITFKDNRLHGFGKPTVNPEKIYYLDDKYFVRHFISYTSSIWINANNRYTDIEFPFKKRISPGILFIYLCVKNFFVHYIKEGGYKLGFTGIAMIEIMINYSLVRSYKLYEKENGLTKETIENNNNIFRDQLLKDLNINI